jgi:hypothetical protein
MDLSAQAGLAVSNTVKHIARPPSKGSSLLQASLILQWHRSIFSMCQRLRQVIEVNAEYRVLLCVVCRHAIVPGATDQHFLRMHGPAYNYGMKSTSMLRSPASQFTATGVYDCQKMACSHNHSFLVCHGLSVETAVSKTQVKSSYASIQTRCMISRAYHLTSVSQLRVYSLGLVRSVSDTGQYRVVKQQRRPKLRIAKQKTMRMKMTCLQ